MSEKIRTPLNELLPMLSYDPLTGIFKWKISKGVQKMGSVAGFFDSEGYIQIGINYKKYKAHRLAWLYFYGEWPKGDIDHINGIKSDNRIANLRECNASENAQNQKKSKSGSVSQYLGVCLHKGTQKWQAAIKLHGRKKYLGLFDTEIEAHRAYLAAKENFHPFSTINEMGK